MKVRTNDCIMALVLLAVSGVFYQQTTTFDPAVVYAFGPVFFPRIAIGIVAALSLILLYQSVDFSGARAASVKAGKDAKAVAPKDWGTMFLRWSLVGMALAYVVTLPLAGYMATTILFLFATMCLLGPRKLRNLATYGAVSVTATLVLYFTFGSLLKMFLP